MDLTSELMKSLSKYLPWNKARLNCFVRMIQALLTVRTVNLVEWTVAFGSTSKPSSTYMRIRRFFRYFPVDFDIIAGLLFNWFGLMEHNLYLTLDRTNWEFGKQKVNVMMLGVVYQGVSIPLYWSLLNKKGPSNYDERVSLLNRFIKRFGKDCIKGVLADREFLGKRWFVYLKKEKIPFYIRVRQNMLISNSNGQLTSALFVKRQLLFPISDN